MHIYIYICIHTHTYIYIYIYTCVSTQIRCYACFTSTLKRILIQKAQARNKLLRLFYFNAEKQGCFCKDVVHFKSTFKDKRACNDTQSYMYSNTGYDLRPSNRNCEI